MVRPEPGQRQGWRRRLRLLGESFMSTTKPWRGGLGPRDSRNATSMWSSRHLPRPFGDGTQRAAVTALPAVYYRCLAGLCLKTPPAACDSAWYSHVGGLPATSTDVLSTEHVRGYVDMERTAAMAATWRYYRYLLIEMPDGRVFQAGPLKDLEWEHHREERSAWRRPYKATSTSGDWGALFPLRRPLFWHRLPAGAAGVATRTLPAIPPIASLAPRWCRANCSSEPRCI